MNTKKGNSLLIILIATLFLAVIGAGVAYWYFIYKEPSPGPTANQQMTPKVENSFPKDSTQTTPQTQPIENSTEVDKLTDELNKTQLDDTTENLTSADFTGL